MSQSDYIKYKRVGSILKLEANPTERQLLPVLSGQEYIDYKQYNIETNVVNAITLYKQLVYLDLAATQKINVVARRARTKYEVSLAVMLHRSNFKQCDIIFLPQLRQKIRWRYQRGRGIGRIRGWFILRRRRHGYDFDSHRG